jgi:PAS domain S-box-containing protein
MSSRLDSRDDQIVALLQSQRAVLERIASGAPLSDVLLGLVQLIERQVPGMYCAILRTDAAGKRLYFAAAPTLSEKLRRAMEPSLEIRPDGVNCAAAAYFRTPVYTEDTASDPRWARYRPMVTRLGIRAIWSTPILSDGNAVLGTFAVYYSEPQLPAPHHLQLIDMATQLARVAIEGQCDDELFHVVFHGAPTAMVIADLSGMILKANPAFEALLGFPASELRARNLSEVMEDDASGQLRPPEDRVETMTSDHRYRTRNGKVVFARTRIQLRQDARGENKYVLILVEPSEESETRALQNLSARELEVLKLVVSGQSSKVIAKQLHVAPASVDTYRSRLMLKLSINDVPSLVRFAIRHGIAP